MQNKKSECSSGTSRIALLLLLFITAWGVLAALKGAAGDSSHAVFDWKNLEPAWRIQKNTKNQKEDAFFWSVRHSNDTAFFLLWSSIIEMRDDFPEPTSTEGPYGDRFSDVLSQYDQFRVLYNADGSTPIPGLTNTNFLSSVSENMVPQGICIAEDYLLISAYDKYKEKNSVLYVLSNDRIEKRQLLTTLVLPEKNHVGGIAFDGSKVWIAKGNEKMISGIFYDRLRLLVETGREVVFLDQYDENLDCGVTASFIGYQGQRIWIGTFHSFFTGQGMLSVYHLVKENEGSNLVKEFTMDIPDRAQGISFLQQGRRNFVVLTTSQGRFRDSALYVYEDFLDDQVARLERMCKYTLPPMAEELISDDTYTYCLFESAATCYSTIPGMKCPWPVDQVCALENDRVLANAVLK